MIKEGSKGGAEQEGQGISRRHSLGRLHQQLSAIAGHEAADIRQIKEKAPLVQAPEDALPARGRKAGRQFGETGSDIRGGGGNGNATGKVQFGGDC